jgi:hypothetical protein
MMIGGETAGLRKYPYTTPAQSQEAQELVVLAMMFEKISTLPFLQSMAAIYYQTVPEKYKGYCILNAQICQDVLRHFNIPAFFIPTQLWYVTDERNYVVGFVGNDPVPGIWDGHVVCATNDYIFDASLIHLRNEHGLDVPDIIVGERFKLPSHALARMNLAGSARLWWHDAPAVVQRYPVLEDLGMVKSLAADLIERLEKIYASDLDAALPADQITVITQQQCG